MKTFGRNVPSKFIIDMSVPPSHSLDSPTVIRTRPIELEVVGSSIINPMAVTEKSDSPAEELMTSSDNERGLAARSREAREQFVRTLRRLRDESQSSLAYLEQLQSNPNISDMPLIHLTPSDTEDMNSDGDQELNSSYFFPPSQDLIAFNDTFEISPSHKSTFPTHSHPAIDSDIASLHRDNLTTQDVTRNVGHSPSDIGSFSPKIVPLMRDISSSDPQLFYLDSLMVPDQDKSPARKVTPALRKRSLSDSCLTSLSTGVVEVSLDTIPPYRTINSSKCDSESTQQNVLLGQRSEYFQAKHNGIENESIVGSSRMQPQELEFNFQGQPNCTFSEEFIPISDQGITSFIENGQFKRVDFQEASFTNDPINSYPIEGENVTDPGDVQRSIKDNLEANISQHELIHESIFSKSEIAIEPPTLTENEPQTSKAFKSQGRVLVDNMWNEFSFSQYLAITPKPKKNLRNTIPCPFSVYYKSLKPKKKTPAQLQGEAKRRLELESEEIECSKKFTSRPVPKSTYEPRYQEILSREENRRQQARNISKETLQSIVKPFRFDARGSEERREPTGEGCSVESSETRDQIFRAKPVPKHLFQTRYEDEVAEQELYREIRKVMRTNKLLSSSRLPRSMSACARSLSYTDGYRRRIREENNSKQAFLTAEHSFKPTVNKRMPDFKRQQELFEQQMSDRKQEQHLTRVEFSDQILTVGELEIGVRKNFEITIPAVSDVLRVSANQTAQAKRKQATAPKAEGVYGHAPTKSTRLRQHLVQERINEQVLKERDEIERAAQQSERVRRMKKQVTERVKKLDNSDKMERRTDEKKRHFREMEASRQIEYTEHLRMIKERLEERPLVFERVARETARDRMADKFNSILRKSGVSEDKLNETFYKPSLSHYNTVSIS